MSTSSSPATRAGASAGFVPLPACWVCGGRDLVPVHRAVFELSCYREQDPPVDAYSGETVDVVRCAGCGFGQPAALPALSGYFSRIYEQQWSREWMDGEFDLGYKDLIFGTVLRRLERRVPAGERTLLDVGAHVGRLVHLAGERGWRAEGVEPNPRTSAYAEGRGLPVRRAEAADLGAEDRRFGAVTMIDVLEHIPDPLRALRAAADLLAPGGWMAVKVPSGPAQLRKEAVRARLRPGYRPTVADNLIHVNHFSARSLKRAMERAGLTEVEVRAAPPELVPGGGARGAASRSGRRAAWAAARVLGASSALALNLEALGRRP